MEERHGSRFRIGVDLGGTKIEALALETATSGEPGGSGRELLRIRTATPRGDYAATLSAIAGLVERLERECGCAGAPVGLGIPGTISGHTGLVKNANSTWLNGRPLGEDLRHTLRREVRVANDANCLAVSEAKDGAGAGAHVVFGVILGTGCGGGVALDGRVHAGPGGVAGEWGHTPLPWPTADEHPGPLCYCGRHGCMEAWGSGPAAAAEFHKRTGRQMTLPEIAQAAAQGDVEATAALARQRDRIGRGLAVVVDVLDPDVIVLGGGVSLLPGLVQDLPECIRPHVFGGEFDTPIRLARHGDSSGVRGAAWLWP